MFLVSSAVLFLYSLPISVEWLGGESVEQNIWQIIWFGLVLVFIIAEFITPTFSFFVWFAAGATVTGVLAYKDWVGPELQVVIFVIISAVLILATKPLQKKIMKQRDSSMDTKERIVGKRVQVIEEINNFKEAGKVYLEGSYWRARSYKDEEIYHSEDIVTVIDIDGIFLIVKK